MLAVDFQEANFTFTKPKDMTDEQCGELRVWVGNTFIDDQGTSAQTIISKWQPSKEDMEVVAAGGAIYLSVMGSQLPPVSVFTEYPFVFPDKH